MNRKCAHVVSVYASERSELGRGAVRALTRRRLLRRADWVTYEALFSGLPVIGSLHSQSVTTLVDDGVNGMIYDPENPTSLSDALNRYLALSRDERQQIPPASRESVATRTPSASAEQLVQAIGYAIATRQGSAASTTIAPTNAAPDDATSSNAIQSLRAPVDGLSPTNDE
jgi:glycosyltransferase involved in cell wall biosynthesis